MNDIEGGGGGSLFLSSVPFCDSSSCTGMMVSAGVGFDRGTIDAVGADGADGLVITTALGAGSAWLSVRSCRRFFRRFSLPGGGASLIRRKTSVLLNRGFGGSAGADHGRSSDNSNTSRRGSDAWRRRCEHACYLAFRLQCNPIVITFPTSKPQEAPACLTCCASPGSP